MKIGGREIKPVRLEFRDNVEWQKFPLVGSSTEFIQTSIEAMEEKGYRLRGGHKSDGGEMLSLAFEDCRLHSVELRIKFLREGEINEGEIKLRLEATEIEFVELRCERLK